MPLKQTLASIAATLLLGSFAHAADTYKVDPLHTSVSFSVRHLGINSVRGKFKEFEGALVLEGDTLKEASGTIQVQSVDTGVEKRDNHLRTADFLRRGEISDHHFQNETRREKRQGSTGFDRGFYHARRDQGIAIDSDDVEAYQRPVGRSARRIGSENQIEPQGLRNQLQ